MKSSALVALFLKGMAMGAADAVPGISGGTIAFISGIYEELINSIKNVNLTALGKLFKEGPLSAWHYINGNFLVILLLGIFTSLYLFASTVEYLLEEHPRFLMSFFVGLILASCWYMLTGIKTWNIGTAGLFVAGLLLTLGLAFLPERSEAPGLLYLFFCGSLAICAMILPGISGAFILILLGAYAPILGAVTDFDLLTLGVFLAGCVTGLIAFSNVLSYFFSHHKNSTLCFLLGVLAGSLYTIWPGRIMVAEGSQSTLVLLYYVLLALFGFVLVYGLERLAKKQ